MGQGIAGDLATNAPVRKPLLCRPQADLDVPQAFPVGEMSKGQAEKRIPAGEALALVISVVPFDAGTELGKGQTVHPWREDRPSRIHPPSPSARMEKYGMEQEGISNRLRTFSLPTLHH